MQLKDYDFQLPPELIAQFPSDKRDHSSLLIVKPQGGLVKTEFYNIVDYLQEGDVMVFNDSKVIKTKLTLNKNGKNIGLNLTKQISANCWQSFAKPGRKLKIGDEFKFDNHILTVTDKLITGEVEIRFDLNGISVLSFLDKYGSMPLPPYIKRSSPQKLDETRYQTVYSTEAGSVAAPTAGLHFTNELLEKIKAKNVEIAFVTLHVGAGTFLPVKVDNINQHKMHSEYCHISESASDIINKAKKEGRRIIAVGTTSLRVMESASSNGHIKAGGFETDIFIKPGFKFEIADLLLTNFHLPKSTLFILTCAFARRERMLEAYNYAIKEKMRFFSYGDAVLLYNNR